MHLLDIYLTLMWILFEVIMLLSKIRRTNVLLHLNLGIQNTPSDILVVFGYYSLTKKRCVLLVIFAIHPVQID